MALQLKFLLMILLMFAIVSGQPSQSTIDAESEELDEDDIQYRLLQKLFHPHRLELTDSLELLDLGFSRNAIHLIAGWQRAGAQSEDINSLVGKLDRNDKKILNQIFPMTLVDIDVVLRQRLQYSASLKGWRILQKGRIQNPKFDITFLAEQDPGEASLSDHLVFAISCRQLPGVDRILLGSFHMKWGGGLLLNQSSNRLGLTPASLVRAPQLRLTPHYSTRETEYFQGGAMEFSLLDWHIQTFASFRRQQGLMSGEFFKEDSDGIHPTHIKYVNKRYGVLGIGGLYHWKKVQLYIASVWDQEIEEKVDAEFGVRFELNRIQSFQFYTNLGPSKTQNSTLSWSHKTKNTYMTVQYRCLAISPRSPNASLNYLLGSTASNEEGLSARLQIRPKTGFVLRYSLDYARALRLQSSSDMRQVSAQKIQIQRKTSSGEWQLDWGGNLNGPFISEDIWQVKPSYSNNSKLSIAFRRQLSSQVQYRINIKRTSNRIKRGLLFQQRLYWEMETGALSIGFVRYVIPDSDLRISIYESNVTESFSFFTAYDDGQRWYMYWSQFFQEQLRLEFRLSQTLSLEAIEPSKQLEFSLQMSVVF